MITNSLVTVKTVSTAKGYIGFDTYVGDKLLCPIRLCSEGSIVASKVEKGENWLQFNGLNLASSRAVALGDDSWVKVTLAKDEPFPRISFRLAINRFKEAGWESDFGKIPFHFLCCYVENADIFHQQGWNIPTPKLEPYVLQHGRQGIVASKWSRDWSYAPPMGALTTPTVGLWAPGGKKYVAYDFTEARLTDHSEKYIASAYCWKKGSEGQFICLAYPHAKLYVTLKYPPENGATVESHFSLIYDLDMPPWEDPAVFYHDYLWKGFAELLPASPVVNDLSWLPGSLQHKDFPTPGYGVRLYTDYKKGGAYVEEGTICPAGWGIPYLQSIDYAYLTNRAKDIARLKEEIEFCLRYAKKFQVDGEECIYWEKPFEGRWKKVYGEGVATLHNVNGWAIAKAMLDIWRHEKVEAYLPYIEGALNWTRHILFTRNGYADVPEAMFTLGEMGIAFCLDYYYTFKGDPVRKDRANAALELARMLTYRYNVLFPSDNDEADNIDAAFLIQPNSGQPWVGAACSNECDELPYVLASVYVATGDQILRHYLLGMLERWPVMYKEMYASSIKDYPHRSITERYGLFDDCPQPRGTRATYGATNRILPMLIFPVGDSKARVVCGEKAAIAFNKEGKHTVVEDYRCSTDGFSFKVRSTLKGEFSLIATFPHRNLQNAKVFLKRDGQTRQLKKDAPDGYRFDLKSFTSIWFNRVRDGDTLAVGKLDETLPCLPLNAVKSPGAKPRSFAQEGFRIVDISPYCNHAPDLSWDDRKSWAPLVGGERYAYGVPYFLIFPFSNQGRLCVSSGRVPIGSAPGERVYLFLSEFDETSNVKLFYADGTEEDVASEELAPAFQAWPMIFDRSIDVVACGNLARKKVKEVRVKNVCLFAITIAERDNPRLGDIEDRFSQAAGALAAERKLTKALKEVGKALEGKRLAIIPPPGGGRPALLLARTGAAIDVINDRYLVDSKKFNARKYPYAFYLGAENYVASVHKPHDAEDALLAYLKDGGFLVVLPSEPFPFYYDMRTGKAEVFSRKLGLPIRQGFEKPPEALTFRLNPGQKIATGIPKEFAFPAEGDLKYRPIGPQGLSNEDVYIPFVTLKNEAGESYGDGGAYIEYRTGELKGARLIYVWFRLLDYPGIGNQIIYSLLSWISKVTSGQPN